MSSFLPSVSFDNFEEKFTKKDLSVHRLLSWYRPVILQQLLFISCSIAGVLLTDTSLTIKAWITLIALHVGIYGGALLGKIERQQNTVQAKSTFTQQLCMPLQILALFVLNLGPTAIGALSIIIFALIKIFGHPRLWSTNLLIGAHSLLAFLIGFSLIA